MVIEKTNIFARPSGLGSEKLKQFSKNIIKITHDQILLNQKVLTLSPNSTSTTEYQKKKKKSFQKIGLVQIKLSFFPSSKLVAYIT